MAAGNGGNHRVCAVDAFPVSQHRFKSYPSTPEAIFVQPNGLRYSWSSGQAWTAEERNRRHAWWCRGDAKLMPWWCYMICVMLQSHSVQYYNKAQMDWLWLPFCHLAARWFPVASRDCSSRFLDNLYYNCNSSFATDRKHCHAKTHNKVNCTHIEIIHWTDPQIRVIQVQRAQAWYRRFAIPCLLWHAIPWQNNHSTVQSMFWLRAHFSLRSTGHWDCTKLLQAVRQ